jgi:DNA-directed RNA polymerase specialized sigma24 family protein
VFAVRDEEAALDIVQDAMLRLAEKYGHRPAAELPLLFHRIVQNAIRDWFRRQKVRSLWTTLFSSLGGRGDDDDQDPLDTLEVPTVAEKRRAWPSREIKFLKLLKKSWSSSRLVNGRHLSCVTGRNWTLPRLPRPWAAPREA